MCPIQQVHFLYVIFYYSISDGVHLQGTLPFMALKVIADFDIRTNSVGITHNFRHNLESLFYILLWICIHYEGPGILWLVKDKVDKNVILGRPYNRNLTAWWNANLNMNNIYIFKSGQMSTFPTTVFPMVTSYFADMKPVLTNFHEVLWLPNDIPSHGMPLYMDLMT